MFEKTQITEIHGVGGDIQTDGSFFQALGWTITEKYDIGLRGWDVRTRCYVPRALISRFGDAAKFRGFVSGREPRVYSGRFVITEYVVIGREADMLSVEVYGVGNGICADNEWVIKKRED